MHGYGIGLGTPRSSAADHVRAARSPEAQGQAPVMIRFGDFELDESNARLLHQGRIVELAPKPFAVLCALARRPGSLMTKNELLDEVWGHRFVTESVLKTVIAKVRRALGDDARQPRVIETVARRGYRLIHEGAALPRAAGPVEAGMSPERALDRICELLEFLTAHGARIESIRPRLLATIAASPQTAP